MSVKNVIMRYDYHRKGVTWPYFKLFHYMYFWILASKNVQKLNNQCPVVYFTPPRSLPSYIDRAPPFHQFWDCEIINYMTNPWKMVQGLVEFCLLGSQPHPNEVVKTNGFEISLQWNDNWVEVDIWPQYGASLFLKKLKSYRSKTWHHSLKNG